MVPCLAPGGTVYPFSPARIVEVTGEVSVVTPERPAESARALSAPGSLARMADEPGAGSASTAARVARARRGRSRRRRPAVCRSAPPVPGLRLRGAHAGGRRPRGRRLPRHGVARGQRPAPRRRRHPGASSARPSRPPATCPTSPRGRWSPAGPAPSSSSCPASRTRARPSTIDFADPFFGRVVGGMLRALRPRDVDPILMLAETDADRARVISSLRNGNADGALVVSTRGDDPMPRPARRRRAARRRVRAPRPARSR